MAWHDGLRTLTPALSQREREMGGRGGVKSQLARVQNTLGIKTLFQTAQYLQPGAMLALHQGRQAHAHTVAVFHGAVQVLAELQQH